MMFRDEEDIRKAAVKAAFYLLLKLPSHVFLKLRAMRLVFRIGLGN
jgi:hypothetical protein